MSNQRPPWNAGPSRSGRRFRIGDPQPTVRSRSPLNTRPQTRADPVPEHTAPIATPELGEPTAARPPSEADTEPLAAGTEKIAEALHLVGTNRSGLISLQLADALETLTNQIGAQQEAADARTDELMDTIASANLDLEATLAPIGLRLNQLPKKIDQSFSQRLKRTETTLRDLSKKQSASRMLSGNRMQKSMLLFLEAKPYKRQL